MEFGYDDDRPSLTVGGHEHKFFKEVMELVKEQNDATDAENTRHRERIIEINNHYRDKLSSLQAQQANRRSASSSAPAFGLSRTSSFLGSSGTSSASTASSGPTLSFTGAPANTSSGTTFSFTSSAASPAPPPAFGNSNSPFIFGSPSPANNYNADQMSMEDSMAEDTVQANHGSTPPTPSFGQQQPISVPAGFVFGSNAGAGAGAGAGANPFQFGAQQNLSMPQSPSPFQATGSQDFNAGGGSFSLDTGGDKSGRRIIKVKHKQRRK
ncbi:nuclear pore complex protein NUP1-like [Punica granatum]|uniref:Nuclear pore complex protein NUP1-like n=1 Tax=Punica granatum TaxID=22663 RepID=A0A6P8BN40_PUNGR|nr:nuclear pore complex protein NUP1-like [Punica granatum]XP_031371381.1 nuclear pore complex protein NUP1-like [Punica granatum]